MQLLFLPLNLYFFIYMVSCCFMVYEFELGNFWFFVFDFSIQWMQNWCCEGDWGLLSKPLNSLYIVLNSLISLKACVCVCNSWLTKEFCLPFTALLSHKLDLNQYQATCLLVDREWISRPPHYSPPKIISNSLENIMSF